jgi:hypothetical protein
LVGLVVGGAFVHYFLEPFFSAPVLPTPDLAKKNATLEEELDACAKERALLEKSLEACPQR